MVLLLFIRFTLKNKGSTMACYDLTKLFEFSCHDLQKKIYQNSKRHFYILMEVEEEIDRKKNHSHSFSI